MSISFAIAEDTFTQSGLWAALWLPGFKSCDLNLVLKHSRIDLYKSLFFQAVSYWYCNTCRCVGIFSKQKSLAFTSPAEKLSLITLNSNRHDNDLLFHEKGYIID